MYKKLDRLVTGDAARHRHRLLLPHFKAKAGSAEYFRHLVTLLPSISILLILNLLAMHFTLSATLSALALLASSVNAWPTKQTYTPASNVDKLAKYFPKSALPAPDGLTLKYVVLGLGTQNYTCATSDENAAPGTTGATGETYTLLNSCTGLTSIS